ncbi:MAG: NYN domain-containing protein [Eubacteriales bacterium]|nr:NYN domain-containing protein [Eubacteriales bacterium]
MSLDKSESLENIAVLIDADNAQLSKLSLILGELSTYGRIVVRRAYGNWNSRALKNWEEQLKKLAIKPEQQFAYTTGKNATDISLAISAMDLLHTELYDAFALVSSDSDYTPLAIRLREAGVYVFGVGEEKTPASFRNACDNFILTQNLGDTEKPKAAVPAEEVKAAAKPAKAEAKADINAIHNLLKTANERYSDAEGWVNIASAGGYIKRVMPDFDSKTYGFSKLTDLIKAFPNQYETKNYPGKGTVTIFAYRCL